MSSVRSYLYLYSVGYVSNNGYAYDYICLYLQLNLMVSGNETSKSKGYNSPHYIAAVVEYFPNLGSNPLQTIQNNLPVYEDIIHNASQYVSTVISLL